MKLLLLLRKNQFGSRWRLDYNVVERQPDGTECVVGPHVFRYWLDGR